MIRKEEVFKIGQFAKPHGVKGEIALLAQGDVLEKMDDPYIVCEMDGILVPFFIEGFRYKSDSVLLVKFENLDTDEAVRPFVNKEAYIPLAAVDHEELAMDMAWNDLVGYEVIDDKHGVLGTIVAVDDSTANVLFCIDQGGEELIFPAAGELVSNIDFERKKIWVSMPEGLLGL